MAWKGWEDFQPGVGDVKAAPAKLSRGARMHAKPCVVDALGRILPAAAAKEAKISGDYFHSKKEAQRWLVLKGLEQAGAIQELQRQVRFPLLACGKSRSPSLAWEPAVIGSYVADFSYRLGDRYIVEDVKGQARREDLYLWKRRHFAAQYGFEITEV